MLGHHRADQDRRQRFVARAAVRLHVDPSLFAFDAVLAVGAYFAVMVLRFDGSVPKHWQPGFFRFLVIAVVVQLMSNCGWGVYRQMWRHASVEEARSLLRAGVTSGALLVTLNYVLGRPAPLSVAVLGSFVATILMLGLRFQARLFAFHRNSADPAGLRVVVVGAGEAGATIVREMQREPGNGLIPVAVIDDDPRKAGKSFLGGLRVVGSTSDLYDIIVEHEAHRVMLAVAGAPQPLVQRVADAAERAEVPLQVLPGFGELMRDRVSLRDVRDLRIEDLIGREEVKTDLEAVRALLRGRRVLITGGGGSIGSEIARQVAACDPAQLVLLDHDETHLYDSVATLNFDGAEQVLADIRDRARVNQVFARVRPDVVFHAAAHKHVPILEAQAAEAVETNVLGTQAIIDAARAIGTERVVFISTDKAVRASSVMGASKSVGEQIVLSAASDAHRFCAVRFGNVLGSRGSVIPTFQRQIAAGGPVTVTDPRMTRYFMTIEEAVQLVLQAAVFAEGGEVFMLEMGEAVNIYELAKRMIRLSGRQAGTEVPIEFTGMRPGEKLEEELAAPDELAVPTEHSSIRRLQVPMIDVTHLAERLAYFELVTEHKDDAGAADALFSFGRARSAIGDAPHIDLVAIERSEAWNPSTT